MHIDVAGLDSGLVVEGGAMSLDITVDSPEKDKRHYLPYLIANIKAQLDDQLEGLSGLVEVVDCDGSLGFQLAESADKGASMTVRKPKDKFGEKEAEQFWGDLPEYLRDANRDQVDHRGVKEAFFSSAKAAVVDHARRLRKILPQLEKAPESDSQGNWEEQLQEAEKRTLINEKRKQIMEDEFLALQRQEGVPPIEVLAEVEHRRWMASMALAGFVYGNEKDATHRLKLRHHIDMRPYAALSGGTKKYDRSVIWEFTATFPGPSTGTSPTA
jgi:hypothetical protein